MLNKMKKLFYNNRKLLFGFVVGLAISSATVYGATIIYSANEISYSKSTDSITNVQDELDELSRTAKLCYGYDVKVEVENGTVTGSNTQKVKKDNTATFELNPNSNYGNGTVTCTNGQTATLSGNTLTTGAITNDTICTVTYALLSRTVTVNATNGTPATQNKTINYNTSTTFTVTPNTNYGGGTVSCTNSQTATLSGTTLTTGNITQDTICTVSYQTGPVCNGSTCPYGQTCKTGYYDSYQCCCTGYYGCYNPDGPCGPDYPEECGKWCTCGGGSYNYCG